MILTHYFCPECGNPEIQITAWLYVNTMKDTGSDPPSDHVWCDECEYDGKKLCWIDYDPDTGEVNEESSYTELGVGFARETSGAEAKAIARAKADVAKKVSNAG